MALLTREIYSYEGTEADLLANLKNGQRGVILDTPTGFNHNWLWKFDGDFYAASVSKAYIGGQWLVQDEEYKNLTIEKLYDSFVTGGIPLGETGEASLDGSFTATSIIGALNELKSSGPGAGEWTRVSLNAVEDYVIPKDTVGKDTYVDTSEGLRDDTSTISLRLSDSSNTNLNSLISDQVSIYGALNKLSELSNGAAGGQDTQLLWNNGGSQDGILDVTTDGTGINFADSAELTLGSASDSTLYSDGTDTIFRNNKLDADTLFYVNDGSVDTELIRLDGSESQVRLNSARALSTLTVGGTLSIDGSQEHLRFYPNGGDTFYTGFKAGAITETTLYTLPLTDGTAGYVLTTDGNGALSWVAGGGGGGSVFTFNYRFETNTTAPPASGRIRYNNATQASATKIYVHDVNNDGDTIDNILKAFGPGDKLYVFDDSDSNVFHEWRITAVTDQTTYVEYDISLITDTGVSFINLQRVKVALISEDAGPGGNESNVQYNKSSQFAGDDTFSWNDASKILSIVDGSGYGLKLNQGTSKIEVIGNLFGAPATSEIYNIASDFFVTSEGEVNITSGSGKTIINEDILVTKNSSHESTIRMQSSTSLYVTGIKASSSTTESVTYTLPYADGTSGQVLQTNGSGIMSWVDQTGGSGGSTDEWRATRITTNQSIPSGVPTTVDFNNEDYDVGNLFDLTTDLFTADETCLIDASSSIYFTINPGGTIELRLYKNSNIVSCGSVAPGVAGTYRVSVAINGLQMTTGDTMKVEVFQNTGQPLSLIGSPCSNFMGHKASATGGSASPGGSNTQLQYNNSGSFGGSDGLTWSQTFRLLKLVRTDNSGFSFDTELNGYPQLVMTSKDGVGPETFGATIIVDGTEGSTGKYDITTQSNTKIYLNSGTGYTEIQDRLHLVKDGVNASKLRWYGGGSTNYVELVAPGTLSATTSYTFPNADGSSGQVLTTNGSGNLSWTTVSGGSTSPGGSDTEIQYNNSSSFGGVIGFTYNSTNNSLNFKESINNEGLTLYRDSANSGPALWLSKWNGASLTTGIIRMNSSNIFELTNTNELFLNPALTLTLGNEINVECDSSTFQDVKHHFFDVEYDNGNSGASKTISLTNGNYQKVTINSNTTLTFSGTNSGICMTHLKVIMDGTGGYTVTLAAGTGSIKYPGGTTAGISNGASEETTLMIYADGTNWYITSIEDWS